MATTAKNVNYTEEQTASMIEAYVANPSKDTVEMLATKMGKSVRSIVAKLSRSGVYQSPAKAEAGKRGESKEKLADAIGRVLGLSENDTSSLEKANAKALQAVFEALANSKPI